MEKIYKISEKRLRYLLEAEAQLEYLESMGVDNWSGYGGHSYSCFIADCMEVPVDEVIENDYDLSNFINKVMEDFDEDWIIR